VKEDPNDESRFLIENLDSSFGFFRCYGECRWLLLAVVWIDFFMTQSLFVYFLFYVLS